MFKFEQRSYSADAVRALIELAARGESKVVESVLGIATLAAFYNAQPGANYQVMSLLRAILVGMAGNDPVDVQLTLVVHLIRVRLKDQNVPHYRIHEAAENYVREMDLSPLFKLQVKQALFDRGEVSGNGITILRQRS